MRACTLHTGGGVTVTRVYALNRDDGAHIGSCITEPEAVLHERRSCAPRLKTAPSSQDGLVRLHFTRVAPSATFSSCCPPSRHLATQRCYCTCVPSVSTSVTCSTCSASTRATPARRAARAGGCVRHRCFRSQLWPRSRTTRVGGYRGYTFLANKPSTLSPEQACTLPVTWSTTHAAIERAGLCGPRNGRAGGSGRRGAQSRRVCSGSRSTLARRGGCTSMRNCAQRASTPCAVLETAPLSAWA